MIPEDDAPYLHVYTKSFFITRLPSWTLKFPCWTWIILNILYSWPFFPLLKKHWNNTLYLSFFVHLYYQLQTLSHAIYINHPSIFNVCSSTYPLLIHYHKLWMVSLLFSIPICYAQLSSKIIFLDKSSIGNLPHCLLNQIY